MARLKNTNRNQASTETKENLTRGEGPPRKGAGRNVPCAGCAKRRELMMEAFNQAKAANLEAVAQTINEFGKSAVDDLHKIFRKKPRSTLPTKTPTGDE